MTYINAAHSTCRPRRSLLTGLVAHLASWRQRRDLKALDDRALDDIGISRRQADAEARRSFWDAPDTWRR